MLCAVNFPQFEDGFMRIFASLALSFACAALISVPSYADEQKPGDDPVLAVVNGTDIHRSEVVESARSLPPEYQAQIEQILPALVERYVDLRLIADRAESTGIAKDPEVKEMVARLQVDVEREVFLKRYLKEHVTDAMLQARYQDFLKSHPPEPEVHARHILVPTEEEAKAVLAKLASGQTFDQVAAEMSKGSSAQKGGDLGYFVKGDMVPEFAEAAFAMKPGEVSKEPVKTQFGYHIIKIEDRRDRQPPTFDQVKPNLESDAQQELIASLIKDLRSAAKVEIKTPPAPPGGAAAPAPQSDVPTPAPESGGAAPATVQ
jgi:peptidyl-prolyl cis-trans isomerase C